MKKVLLRLQELVNKEIYDYDYTIKGFALRCGMSYTEMRSIANGHATDIRISTIEKICANSHIEMSDIFIEDVCDIIRVFSRLTILYDTDRYSVSLSRYK